jgi:hypothetical protein
LKDGKRTVRIRRYDRTGRELEARDFDISSAPLFDRAEFVGESSLVTFHSNARERGIHKLSLR